MSLSASERRLNLHVRVVRILRLITGELASVSEATTQLIESLLWTLLAWRKLDVEHESRFVRSMVATGKILMSMRDEVDSDQVFLKAWTNHYMCASIGDLTNSAPRPKKALFVGFVRAMVGRLLARADSSFFYSLLQSKRFWPQLGCRKELEMMKDTKKRLCEPGPSLMSEEMGDEIARTSMTIFRDLSPPTKMSPSFSACYQASVREGGAYSLFKPLVLETDQRLGLLRGFVMEHELWKRSTFLAADFRSVDYLGGSANPRCQMIIIPEPSKFRSITKGNGYLYTRLQPLQGALLKAWKSCRYSTMTGDLDEKVCALAKSPEPYFCSGDFKAATDTLDQLATFAAAAGVDVQIDSSVCSRAVQPSVLEFPDGTVGLQIGGQLMGHPLSFPLLCVINLAVYRFAVKRYCREFAPEKKRQLLRDVLVNGDDILFKCDHNLYRIWTESVHQVGLIISPGKNYLSRDFCTINSRLYERLRGSGVLRRRGYINLKLVKGFSLKTGESAATPDQLGKDVSDMIRFCPKALGTVPAVFSRFSYPGWSPNWFLPVHLGGYGVDPAWAPDDLRVTREQRVMALVFYDQKLTLFRRDGATAPHVRFLQTLGPSFEWVESFDSPTENDWTGRLAEIASAAQGSLFVGQKDPVVRAAVRLVRSRSFHPLSLAEVIKRWNRVLRPFEAAPVPPPGVLAY